MSSQIFFVSRSGEKESFLSRIKRLAEKVIPPIVSADALVGIKVHFGEEGNTGYLPPTYIRPVVEVVAQAGGRPFLFDTNTLYRGQRDNARDHLLLAYRHGFTPEVVGAPVLIADGLRSRDYLNIPVGGKHFSEVKIASIIRQMDACVVISHVKGHSTAGFGGAIKNLSMGFASRSGKQQMHSDAKPSVDGEKCTLCGTCVLYCPVEAITLTAASAVIDEEKCVGCNECRVVCKEAAIGISWETTPTFLQEKMVEYAAGVMRELADRITFLNFLVQITPDCDCWEWSEPPVVADIGVLGGTDPVALDQASCDLLQKKAGRDVWRELYPQIDWEVQLRYGESFGLGSRSYTLEELD